MVFIKLCSFNTLLIGIAHQVQGHTRETDGFEAAHTPCVVWVES